MDKGGTWFENIYPGVRCDTPSHAYQATFCHKEDWSESFPPGREICDYWQSLARQHDVYTFTKFKHKVEQAVWDGDCGKWNLTLLDLGTNSSIAAEYDLVLTCVGRFNAWKLPHYEGIDNYKGLLRHTSNWDASFDLTGKTVAVIGNGASGVQLVPSLQKTVKHLDHYARSPTWAGFSEEEMGKQGGSADKGKWQNSLQTSAAASYVAFRRVVEDAAWRGYRSFLRGSEENYRLREKFTRIMTSHFTRTKRRGLLNYIPDFSPNCRRQTPGPGYLESITADNVSFIQTPIKRFTTTGIETQDGMHREVDAIFCATGSDTAVAPQFGIFANDQDLRDSWKPGGNPGFPYTYLGMATPGFPNLLFIHGPHGISPSGTVPYAFETQLTYVAKLLRKVAKEGIKSVSASAQAADDFIAYSDAFFKTTVLTDGCSSSYNGGQPGAKIHGFWPGSAAHLAIVRREPRWEDWEYQYLSESGNRFSWYFGNGLTKKEGDLTVDMAAYLQSEAVDLRDIHESWWRIP
jgi:cation diffusion facilitator CzcD-associated flavoprotein CzcO